MAQRTIELTETNNRAKRFSVKAIILLSLPIILLLIAIFPMDAWADAAGWHHAIQHIIIFIVGIGFGAEGLTTLKRGESK